MDIKFISLKFIQINFIKFKKHVSGKNELICLHAKTTMKMLVLLN